MSSLEKSELQLGYIPLLDCIALLWAKQRGLFEAVGLNVTLTKEASWASLRDRLAFGLLDAAHCLSAMLPAAAIGADQIGQRFHWVALSSWRMMLRCPDGCVNACFYV
jgi:NitT/TauT family transport system ATP-binding protein